MALITLHRRQAGTVVVRSPVLHDCFPGHVPVTNYEYDYETAYANQTRNGNVQTQLKSTVAPKLPDAVKTICRRCLTQRKRSMAFGRRSQPFGRRFIWLRRRSSHAKAITYTEQATYKVLRSGRSTQDAARVNSGHVSTVFGLEHRNMASSLSQGLSTLSNACTAVSRAAEG